MKYLFINSTAGWGSTGGIVAETCRELMAEGHQCRIAFGRKEPACPDIPVIRIGSEFINKVSFLESHLLDNHGFGPGGATRKLIRQIREYDPDVIWLHNLHGYYIHVGILFSYLRTCGKQIIWTLHDCWAFTGHCCYFDYAQCEKWKTGCHHCPDKKVYPASWLLDRSSVNYRKKKELFTGISNLRLVVPSHWLESRVKQGFLREYPVEVRYNRVDKTVFHPVESDFRQKYHLENKKILLGVASVWDRRKGLPDFAVLSGMLDESYQIVLVGLRQDQLDTLPKAILGLPRTKSVQELVEIYSAADLFLNPSVEETFGMTVLEAQYCGTPAVVYEDTACQEIAETFGGLAVPRGPEHLLEAVTEYFGRSI